MMKELFVVLASVLPNFIKIPLYRLIGYKIGRMVKINFLTIILGNKVNIGDNVKIGPLNIFKLKNLEIGENSVVRGLNMFIGPNSLKLGKRVQIVGPYTFMNLAEDIELDNECGIGSHSIFYTHGVYLPYTEGHPRKFDKIYLGERVWSPTNVTFLPGVNVEKDSIISAGSVVNRSFPENSFISGNPAKRISKASFLKRVVTPKVYTERKNKIIKDFISKNVISGAKIDDRRDRLVVESNKGRYLIKQHMGKWDLNSDNYKEVILLGENLSSGSRNVSLFDLKKRKKKVNGKLGRQFLEHLETYGEYFI